MSDQYNNEVSKHYAAYRPPIHQRILELILKDRETSAFGLDIGCGTGVSTQALSPYCAEVLGVEPSEAMLSQAQQVSNGRYLQGDGETIPLAASCADLVTFAGSLYYAKSAALVEELRRVTTDGALIVVYDFEVQLSGFMQQLGIELPSSSSGYDHEINFSDCQQMKQWRCEQQRVELTLSSQQLAHVLFSSSTRYQYLLEKFGQQETFERVLDALNQVSDEHLVSVDCYFSTYSFAV